jgi:hypothetical protein
LTDHALLPYNFGELFFTSLWEVKRFALFFRIKSHFQQGKVIMMIKRFFTVSILVASFFFFLWGCGTPIIPRSPKPMVNVFNGCSTYCTKVGVKGLAREVNKKLVESGYIVGEPKNLTSYKIMTEIIHNPADEEAAKYIREIIAVGKLLSQEEVPSGTIQVILGMDSVVPTFDTLKVEMKILVLNSTRRQGLAKDMKTKIDHNLTTKYPFYTPDNADRYFYETMVYYPPEHADVAQEVLEAVAVGAKEPVEYLKDVVVVLGLEFDPRTQRRIGLTDDVPEVRIVVDKTDFRLKVYEITSGNLVGDYPITIGKNPDLADKEEVGDNRTPEGTFKVVSIEDSSGWVYEDEYAYGPWFIRLATPPWTGIGIHGTNEPEKIGMPDSRGCIRMHNDDVGELVKIVQVGTVVEVRH